jgi:hypothetical protein
VRCPTCVQKKDPHYVYRVQRVPTTNETTTMWDNDDTKHIHNPNVWVTDYRCTHGHTFTQRETKEFCPVEECDWGRAGSQRRGIM